jgi:hypothetical protein
MKKIKLLFFMVICSTLILSCEKKETTDVDNQDEKLVIPANIKLGDFFAGGYVFYLKPDKSGGMVFAPSDASVNPVEWGCMDINAQAPSDKVGDGSKNTVEILKACGGPNTAARVCDTYVSAGYSDWFLPSLDELILINDVAKGGAGPFNKDHTLTPGNYWSSSESSNDHKLAFTLQVFDNREANKAAKQRNEKYKVRAAREF